MFDLWQRSIPDWAAIERTSIKGEWDGKIRQLYTLDVRDFPPYNLTHMYWIGVPLSTRYVAKVASIDRNQAAASTVICKHMYAAA
jgi:hypothetical protein